MWTWKTRQQNRRKKPNIYFWWKKEKKGKQTEYIKCKIYLEVIGIPCFEAISFCFVCLCLLCWPRQYPHCFPFVVLFIVVLKIRILD